MGFKLVSEFSPKGDQAKAIEQLTDGLINGIKHQVLLGVTGSGKTFTMANVIDNINKPTLVMVHNKTLAARRTKGAASHIFPGLPRLPSKRPISGIVI